MSDTLFTNGALFDGHRHVGARPRCWSRTGGSSSVGERT